MSVKTKPAYYRLELDDCSVPAFTSFGKYYYGTLNDLRAFFDALGSDEVFKLRCSDLTSTFRAFEAGQKDLKHNVAYRDVPFLVPVRLLHSEKITLENHAWTHLNTWDYPYYMRCDKVESEHLWLACGREYCRVAKASFTKLQYTARVGKWNDVGTMLWGFPCILAGDANGFWNRLAEPEKHFNNRVEAELDWESFRSTPDPDYAEFCNDIFGDG